MTNDERVIIMVNCGSGLGRKGQKRAFDLRGYIVVQGLTIEGKVTEAKGVKELKNQEVWSRSGIGV